MEARRGITLLEVLISMFILLIGLLGVASLIPVGKFEVQRGAKVERSAATGRAALRDLNIRGSLHPNQLALADGMPVFHQPTRLYMFDGATAAASRTPAEGVPAFCFDPLGVKAGYGPWFPTNGNATPSALTTPPTPPLPPFLPRLTVNAGTATAISAMAEEICRAQDDLVFSTEGDDGPATQVLQGNSKRLSVGDYSWFATAIPDPGLVTPLNWESIPYRVTVAVSYKRPLITPVAGVAAEAERTAKVSAITGHGELTLTTAGVSPTTADKADHLKIVKPGQWLMIAGYDTVAGSQRWNFRWYRILSAADQIAVGAEYERSLSLAGPDWSVPAASATVYLFDGVIACYERTQVLVGLD